MTPRQPGQSGLAQWVGLALMAAAPAWCVAADAPAPVAASAQATPPASTAAPAAARTALRVCQDPSNMPFSNEAGEGIENKLAQMMGKDFGLPVTFYSFPQRMNFVRNTIRYKLPGADYPCDIIMGVPVGFEQVSVTKPYYRSTYALVIPEGKLDGVKSQEDLLALPPEQLRTLRIGVIDKSPAADWLAKHGLLDQGVPYPLMDADPAHYPGELVEKELKSGKVDVVIAWGPLAGYYAQRAQAPKLRVVPMHSEGKTRFEFDMAMGVRYGEREWKAQVEQWIDSHRPQIKALLESYQVPLVDMPPPASEGSAK